jgi:hypothetical protein
MSTCNLETLKAQACSGGFWCAESIMLQAVRLQLLCNIQNSGPAPDAPTGGDISASSSNANLILTWGQASAPTTNEVWRSKNGGAFTLLASIAGALTTYTDTDATMSNGDQWCYKVRATNGSGSSAFTTQFCALKNYTLTVDAGALSVSFPDVVFVVGSVDIENQVSMTSISFPRLHTMTGNVTIGSMPALTTVNFNSLVSVVDIVIAAAVLPSLSFPALVTVSGGFIIQHCDAVTVFSIPLLASVGGNFSFDQTAIVNFSAPSLVSVGTTITGNNLNLQSVSMPVLTTVGEDIVCHVAPLLTSVDMPVVIYPNGGLIDFTQDGLDDTSINQILARGVASNVTICQFVLDAGTNSAPTGQGVVDAGILTGQGNTVITN